MEVYTEPGVFKLNYDTGLAYLLTPDFQFDFSGGWQGSEQPENWFLNFGISWRTSKGR